MVDLRTKMLFFRSLQTEIMVKAIDVELLQVFSKLHWLPQVKCSSLHGSNLSYRNQDFIHRQKSTSFYSDFLVIDIQGTLARQVDIRMVGQVDWCGLTVLSSIVVHELPPSSMYVTQTFNSPE